MSWLLLLLLFHGHEATGGEKMAKLLSFFTLGIIVHKVCTVWLVFHVSCIVICLWCSSDDSPTTEADEVPLIMTEQVTGFDTDEGDYLMRSRSARNLRKKSVMYYLCDAWIEACSRCVVVFCLLSDYYCCYAEKRCCWYVASFSGYLSLSQFVNNWIGFVL